MPDTDLSIAVRWAEAGADVPARTAANLRLLDTAAGGSVSQVDRLGQAFTRLEAREPTMALRSTRFAIASLASEAIGATGPLAKLGEAALLLGAGTGTGLAIMGGLALIGAGYNTLTAGARAAAEATKKLSEEVVSLAQKGSEFRQTHIGLQRGQAEQDLTKATQKLADLHVEFDRVSSRHMRLLAEGANTLDAWKERVEAARKAWQDQLAIVRELKGAVTDLGRPGELAPVTVETTAAISASLSARVARAGAGALTMGTTTFGFPGFVGLGRDPTTNAFTFDRAGRVLAGDTDEGMGRTADRLAGIALDREGRDAQKDNTVALRTTERAISGLAAIVVGASRGGPAGALGGLGAGISGLAGVSQHLASLGPIGTGISAAGSILGIFSGGSNKMHVQVDAYGEQALEQERQLRSDPLTTQIIVVGGMSDMRSVQYALARLGRRDAVTRLP
jgi:hypothetical protein